jgi:pantoate--beta-alanine ligase
MIVAKTIAEIRQAVWAARKAGERIGLVPTMGALHEGHFSLIRRARGDCPFVVVSIFVNPAQFGPGEDFARYPRTLEQDLEGCRRHGAGAVFAPDVPTMYPAEPATTVHVKGLTEHLCGASRPGHFDGVCTVVTKLFNIVMPDVACFGAKDYQQAATIRQMAIDLNMPLEVVVCPTVREADGLAMSSRNRNLSREERRQATALIESLRMAQSLAADKGVRGAAELINAIRSYIAQRAPLGRIDYVEVIHPRTLKPLAQVDQAAAVTLAVKFPSARLIDNLTLAPGPE